MVIFMNITIGQYYPSNSIIHRLDPRVKIISTFAFIVALFMANSFGGYFLALIFLAFLIEKSNVPVKLMLMGLKGIAIIILFTVVLNIFFVNSGTVLFEFKLIKITTGGLLIASKMAVRLMLLVVGSSILTLTTSPIELTEGIESLLKPLKRFGVPSHEIAMMMSISLRFIPTLVEELDKIKKAQMARGADFETGGLIKKAQSLIPLLVPLFISAFRRADELAMAMEARCYRGDVGRTRMKALILKKPDYTAIFIMTAFVVIILALRIFVKL